MNPTIVAVPGAKKITITIPAPGIDGRAPMGSLSFEGFEAPTPLLLQLEIGIILLQIAHSIMQGAFNEQAQAAFASGAAQPIVHPGKLN